MRDANQEDSLLLSDLLLVFVLNYHLNSVKFFQFLNLII